MPARGRSATRRVTVCAAMARRACVHTGVCACAKSEPPRARGCPLLAPASSRPRRAHTVVPHSRRACRPESESRTARCATEARQPRARRGGNEYRYQSKYTTRPAHSRPAPAGPLRSRPARLRAGPGRPGPRRRAGYHPAAPTAASANAGADSHRRP